MGRSIPVGHQHDDEVDSGDDVSSPGASDGDDCWDANPRNQHVSIGVCDCFYDTETSQDMQIGQRERLARGISDQILSFYNAGVPFFTKEGMRTIVAQLDAYYQKGSDLSNKLISLPTISGETVEVNIESGNRSPSGSANIELIMGKAMLEYRTYQMLNENSNPEFLCKKLALCPMVPLYPLIQRYQDTDGTISSRVGETVENVQKVFQDAIYGWEGSQPCKELRAKLEKTDIPRIKNIVALAFCGMAYGDAYVQASAYQHALILTIRDAVCKKGGLDKQELSCIAQDPAYMESDKSVLSDFGIKIVDDPRAFLQVDNQSVVMTFSPNIPVKQIVTDIARPAILICNVISTIEEAEACRENTGFDPEGCTDPDSSRVRDMIFNEYYELMRFEEQEEMGFAAVYIRKEKQSEYSS